MPRRSILTVRQRSALFDLPTDDASMLYHYSRYQSRRDDDTELRQIAKDRRRFGYRRLQAMVERQGWQLNHKKLRRIYREEKLQVRRRGGRKRALGTRRSMVVPDSPNQRWSLDFVSDALADGRCFHILTMVDDHTRENLALAADTSLSSLRVTRDQDRLIAERGTPCTIVSDNGHHGHTAMGAGNRDRLASHRAGKTNSERVHRKLQRQAAPLSVDLFHKSPAGHWTNA